MFKFLLFNQYPSLRYGFSNKKDGSMHCYTRQENRAAYFRKIGIDPRRVVTMDSVHGANAVRVDDSMAGTMVPKVDGLVADTQNLFLSATSADCFLIYLYCPVQSAIGIAHAGWRGVLKDIAPNTIRLMQKEFGTDPKDLLAGIGPGIRKCHFEIKPGTEKRYQKYPAAVSRLEEKIFVDLPGIIKEQMLNCGLRQENIMDSGQCTFCNPEEYFSYRRDKPEETEPMVAHIGLL